MLKSNQYQKHNWFNIQQCQSIPYCIVSIGLFSIDKCVWFGSVRFCFISILHRTPKQKKNNIIYCWYITSFIFKLVRQCCRHCSCHTILTVSSLIRTAVITHTIAYIHTSDSFLYWKKNIVHRLRVCMRL